MKRYAFKSVVLTLILLLCLPLGALQVMGETMPSDEPLLTPEMEVQPPKEENFTPADPFEVEPKADEEGSAVTPPLTPEQGEDQEQGKGSSEKENPDQTPSETPGKGNEPGEDAQEPETTPQPPEGAVENETPEGGSDIQGSQDNPENQAFRSPPGPGPDLDAVDAIYLDGENGDDGNSGVALDQAVKTFSQAKELALAHPNIQTIWVSGTVQIEADMSLPGSTAVFKRHASLRKPLFKMESGSATFSQITIDGNSDEVQGNIGSLVNCVRQKNHDAMNLTFGAGAVLRNNWNLPETPGWTAGGAVLCMGHPDIDLTTLTILEGSLFENCRATQGGGIRTDSLTLNMTGGTFRNNQSPNGLTGKGLNQLDYNENDVAGAGGGIYLGDDTTMNLTDGLFENNFAAEVGGAVAVSGLATARKQRFNMTGGTMKGNGAGATGGAIFVQAGYIPSMVSKARITGGQIIDNYTTGVCRTNKLFGGGAIYVNGYKFGTWSNGELYLENALIVNNSAAQFGGGYASCPISRTEIHVNQGVAIYGNQAASNAGRDIFVYGSTDPALGAHAGRPYYHIADRMLGGQPYYWKDMNGNLVPEEQLTGELDNTSLLLYTDENGDQTARPLAKVIISGNRSATNGGGIGSNGTVIMGRDEPKRKLMVKKAWQDGMDPREVTIQLRGKLDGQDWLVEEVVLNAANGFQHTFKNLPEKILDRPIEEIFYVVEVGVNPADVEISPLQPAPATTRITVIRPEFGNDNLHAAYANACIKTKDPKYWDNDNWSLKDFQVDIHFHDQISGQETVQQMHYTAEGAQWDGKVNFETSVPADQIEAVYYDGADGQGISNVLYSYDVYLEPKEGGGYVLKLPHLTGPGVFGQGQIFRHKAETAADAGTFLIQVLNKKPVVEEVEVKVQKIWADNDNQSQKRPASVEFELLADGVPTGNTRVVSEQTGWMGSFAGLPKLKEGRVVVYTLRENNPPTGYRVQIAGDMTVGFTVTNTWEPIQPPPPPPENPPETEVHVRKVWMDQNNAAQKRPDQITVKLLADGVDTGRRLTLSIRNNWTGIFAGLPKTKDGRLIHYTIQETSIPAGYLARVEGDGVTGFVLTNTYVPPTPPPTETPKLPRTGERPTGLLSLALLGLALGLTVLRKRG